MTRRLRPFELIPQGTLARLMEANVGVIVSIITATEITRREGDCVMVFSAGQPANIPP